MALSFKPLDWHGIIESAEAQIVEQSKRIEFYLTEYSIELLAQKMDNGDFFIPEYQREFTWDHKRQSRFIESVIMGLPIPFLFFWENPDTGELEIVDGSQRLRTIREFILGDLALGELRELSLLEGLTFRNLPESRQRKIKNRSIRGIVLNEHADEEARFDLFDRINTGSLIANQAEIRRGVLRGPFMELVKELAQETSFHAIAPVSAKAEKEREREELVTRFFAYSDGWEEYRDQVSPFLWKYSKRMNSQFLDTPDLQEDYRQRFHHMVAFVTRNFPQGFRRPTKSKRTASLTPHARFEAIAVGTHLALRVQPDLLNSNVDVTNWLSSDDFRAKTGSDGANAKGRLAARIEFVRDRLLGA